jgi:hypothetical protein
MKKYYKRLITENGYRKGIIYPEEYSDGRHVNPYVSFFNDPSRWEIVPEIDYFLQVAKEKYKEGDRIVPAWPSEPKENTIKGELFFRYNDIWVYGDDTIQCVYDGNTKQWAEIVEEKKTITDYENDTMMDKKHTIKDLSNGKVACLNDVNVDQLRKVMRAAFPKDTIMPSGADRFYIKCKRNKDEWTGEYDTSLPTVSAEALLKEIENNTTMDKPMTHQEAIKNLIVLRDFHTPKDMMYKALDLAIKNIKENKPKKVLKKNEWAARNLVDSAINPKYIDFESIDNEYTQYLNDNK